MDPSLPAPVMNPGLSDNRAPGRWGNEGLGLDWQRSWEGQLRDGWVGTSTWGRGTDPLCDAVQWS